MGHKVHPYGFRLGVSRTWTAKWYADKEYTTLLQEDIAIRSLVARRLANASISQIEIERGINRDGHHPPPPGIVIGKGGANVEALRQQIGRLSTRKVKLEIKEIRQPELDAILVAANIAQQLSRRIAFKKAMKQAVQRTMKAGAKGVKIMVAGRLGDPRWLAEGQGRPIPPDARADISYGWSTPTRPTVGRRRCLIYWGASSRADAGARRGRRPVAAAAAQGCSRAHARSQGHARTDVRRLGGFTVPRRYGLATPSRPITSRQIEVAAR